MSNAYYNLMTDKLDLVEKMDDGGRKQNTVSRIGAAGVFLGLLCFILLAVPLGLVAHRDFRAISYWSQHQVTRHEHGNLTSQVMDLQTRLNNFTDERKKAPAEGHCFAGWIEVNRKCYFISAKEVSKTWLKSKEDCQHRRARLVIIKTKSELEALSLFHDRAWIGLSDRRREGNWMWEDGTRLMSTDLWMDDEPNNANGNEDCAHLNMVSQKTGFNDNNCDIAFPYICEALN